MLTVNVKRPLAWMMPYGQHLYGTMMTAVLSCVSAVAPHRGVTHLMPLLRFQWIYRPLVGTINLHTSSLLANGRLGKLAQNIMLLTGNS